MYHDNENPLRIFSYGGGVQSTAVLVLQSLGQIVKPFDYFVFSNVGNDSEHPATLEYMQNFAVPFAEKHGVKLVETQKVLRSGEKDTIVKYIERSKRSIPLPVRMSNGAPGNRSCTTDFKIRVVDKWIKRLIKFESVSHVEVGLGISTDELQRMKGENWHNEFSGRKFGFMKRRVHPLIDLKINRNQCHTIIESVGLPVPPPSACFFCPFTSRNGWIALDRQYPDLFNQAVAMEQLINSRRVELGKDAVYFHSSLLPLGQAVASNQLDMFGAFDSCDGYCHT